MWVTLRPMASSTGRARVTASAAPPTMIDSVPSIAPCWPPETGASRKSTPDAAERSASARAASGAMVLVSITSNPAEAPVRTPSGPATTCSTSGPSGSDVTTASTARATAAADAASRAPSAIRGSIRPRLRPRTTTS